MKRTEKQIEAIVATLSDNHPLMAAAKRHTDKLISQGRPGISVTGAALYIACNRQDAMRQMGLAGIIEIKDYCTQNDGNCDTCSLVNYGQDCHNNPV